jgi:N4-gp56 family major capsid protein
MAYNEPAQGKLVGYANTDGVSSANYNTQAGVTIKPDAYYDMMLLKMLRQMEFHYSKYAIQKTLPKNFGDTINWRRFKKLEVRPDRGLLTEGVTPEGKEGINGESIVAVIQQYGEVMYFTDLVDIMQLDDVRREYTIELGYIAQETLDLIVRDVLVNEGSVFFAGAQPSLADVVAAAKGNDVAKLTAIPKIDEFRKMLLGFKKDFVTGVRGAAGRYVALVSPEVMFALFDDQRMLQYMSFGQTNAPLMDGVVIDMFGIRFEEVLNAPTVELDGEVLHDSIILADEAYAITKLAGEGNVRVITKGLGSAGVSDPLDQRQSIGYKITGFGAKVLRPESVINYWSVPNAAEGINVSSEPIARPDAARTVTRNPLGAPSVAQGLVSAIFSKVGNLFTHAATYSAAVAQVEAGYELDAIITFNQELPAGAQITAITYEGNALTPSATAGDLQGVKQIYLSKLATEDLRNAFNGHAGTLTVTMTGAGLPADIGATVTQVVSNNDFITFQVVSEASV